METVSSDNPEINVNKDEIVIVDAGQKEAEIPLYMKNAPMHSPFCSVQSGEQRITDGFC